MAPLYWSERPRLACGRRAPPRRASRAPPARPPPLGEQVPDVAIHAQLIEQIISQDFIERPDWANGLEIVLTFALCGLVTGLVLLFGAQFSSYAGIDVIASAVPESWFGLSHFRLLIDPMYPSLAALATYVT